MDKKNKNANNFYFKVLLEVVLDEFLIFIVYKLYRQLGIIVSLKLDPNINQTKSESQDSDICQNNSEWIEKC